MMSRLKPHRVAGNGNAPGADTVTSTSSVSGSSSVMLGGTPAPPPLLTTIMRSAAVAANTEPSEPRATAPAPAPVHRKIWRRVLIMHPLLAFPGASRAATGAQAALPHSAHDPR